MKTKVTKQSLAKTPAAPLIEGSKKDLIFYLNAANNFIQSKGKNGIVAVYIEDFNQRNQKVVEHITNQQTDLTKEHLTIPVRKARALNAALDEKGHVVFDEKGEPKFTPEKLIKLSEDIDAINDTYNAKIKEFNGEKIKYTPVIMPKDHQPKDLSDDYKEVFKGFIL
jgi:hypothetical protein